MAALTERADSSTRPFAGRLWGALTALSLVGLYATLGRDPVAVLILAPVALLSALVPWRLRLGLLAQGAVSSLLLGVALVMFQALPGPQVPFRGVMGPLVPLMAMGSILLVEHRLFLDQPAGGDRTTVAHGLWCLVACGSQRAGLVYVAGCALYLLLASAWLRGSARPWALGRHRGWWFLQMALSAALAGALAWTIPRAHRRVVGWLVDTSPQVGLQEGPMELGSLEGLADSDQVVARLFGWHGSPLLRGVVYQEYSHGRWLTRPSSFARTVPIGDAGGRVQVVYEPTEFSRFLLPLEASSLALNTPSVVVDPFGVFSPIYGSSVQWARYEPGPREVGPVNEPEPVDLELPSSLRPSLERRAARWVGGAATAEQRVERLRATLAGEHPYAIHFRRPPGRDPVLAFLDEPGAAGHCEYFASAMVLLARSVGVPARVVGGYRVSEFNPVGDYHVVRERHAHAWAEVYLAGQGWRSVDATPPDSFSVAGPTETPAWSAWLDAVRVRGLHAWRFVLERPALVALGLVPVLLVIVGRELWSRWRARRARRAQGSVLDPPEPRPYLPPLLDVLASRGLLRAPAESLESLARRVEQTSPSDEAPGLLRRYAALVYGGVGREDEVRDAIVRYVQASPRASS